MQVGLTIIVLVAAYLIGSIPFGLLIVKLRTGQDIRSIESGRTGGTNAMRAAGFWAGLATAMLDIFKATVSVWAARFIMPGNQWLEVLAAVLTIIGHNYSIFLLEKDQNGKFRLRGGAGGAPCVGGSAGLWFPSLFLIIPIGALVFYFIGYASVATLSVALISALVFAYRAWIGVSSWLYAIYGLVAFFILVWALRPNIRRLLKGQERLVGLRAKLRRKANSSQVSH